MRMMPALCALLFACATSSATVNDQPAPEFKAEDVRVTKIDPPSECALLGGITEWGYLDSGFLNNLRQRAAEKGGNWVVMDNPNGGRLYKCPKAAVVAFD